jgi:hypothetical protein
MFTFPIGGPVDSITDRVRDAANRAPLDHGRRAG